MTARRAGAAGSGKTVLLVGSDAAALANFRGPLIGAMAERGHRVIAAAAGMAGAPAGAVAAFGAEARELPLANASLNPLGLARAYRALRRLVREVGPDVLIAYTIQPVIAGALAAHREGVPRIVSLITGIGYAFAPGREPKRLAARLAASALYRLALACSHEVIFQNPDDQALFEQLRLLSPDRLSRVVNGSGVDLGHFSPAPLPRRPAFLMIARLLKDKGVLEYAEAARRMKRAYPDVPAALAGYLYPSPNALTQAQLDAIVRSGIDFRGRLDDVRPAIVECSVFVLPSYAEGTPRSVLEAMAMGRAIVTTDVPGCRETVIDGVNGFLVPPRDPGALHDAMLRFVREPSLAASMGAQSLRIAREKYDVRSVNAAMLEIAGL